MRDFRDSKTYSVNAVPGGSGRGAFITFTKTRAWFDAAQKSLQAAMAERLPVEKLLEEARMKSGVSSSSSSSLVVVHSATSSVGSGPRSWKNQCKYHPHIECRNIN